MAKRAGYTLIYAPEVHGHVDALDKRVLRALRKAIVEQLSFAPLRETRNRKPLERTPGPFGATWELRCGQDNRLRVFYEVAVRDREVFILAIGLKDRERLFIAGKEFSP